MRKSNTEKYMVYEFEHVMYAGNVRVSCVCGCIKPHAEHFLMLFSSLCLRYLLVRWMAGMVDLIGFLWVYSIIHAAGETYGKKVCVYYTQCALVHVFSTQ